MRLDLTFSFRERTELLGVTAVKSFTLGVYICAAQKRIGDFHLKTCLAFTAAILLQLEQYTLRKRRLIDIGLSEPATTSLVSISSEDALLVVRNARDGLREILVLLRKLQRNLTRNIDPDLEDSLTSYISRLGRYAEEIADWARERPSKDGELHEIHGVLRDCWVFDFHIPDSQEVKFVRESNLKDPFTRALYLSANAYLEITSIDIICDLICEAIAQRPSQWRELIWDLSRQLSDEAKHADVLSYRG